MGNHGMIVSDQSLQAYSIALSSFLKCLLSFYQISTANPLSVKRLAVMPNRRLFILAGPATISFWISSDACFLLFQKLRLVEPDVEDYRIVTKVRRSQTNQE
ncbi:hypothetical protein L596_013166 [Steinernema carpocapsae]|uniref:Uncharacterized protein n=1 Tax=Steinernema carpocapsae TaxID=34508 RepID=A0A4U5NZI5_STECR|nr:hypothetical protein L596_013166 [Steinernema carpocapsae]